MAEIADYTVEIVERAKSFAYEELYDANDALGNVPVLRAAGDRDGVVLPLPRGARRATPTARCASGRTPPGRYIDRARVRALLADGTTGVIDGFTARDGRTYRGVLDDRHRGVEGDGAVGRLERRGVRATSPSTR